MLRTFQSNWLLVLLAAGGLTLASRPMLRADEAKAGLKKADASVPNVKTEIAEKDPFAVPEGTPDDLLKFIDKTSRAQPGKGKSQVELIDFFKNSRRAMVAAADKILASGADGKIRVRAIEVKFEALGLLERLNDADAAKQLKELVAKIKDDKDPAVKALAAYFDFRSRMAEAVSDAAAGEKFWKDIKSEVKTTTDKRLASLAGQFAGRQEHSDPEAAAKLISELAEIVAQNKDAEIVQLAKRFNGIVRRLKLMGKPMEITGTMLDGTPFDQGSLKGKVVLVDFWATWCGPCRAEMPNVKSCYEKYHGKGFEVVGVSLDQDAKPLKKFIEDEKIPWLILFPQEKKDQFWNNPLAVYYGVNGIPCLILMNQKGEVVSLNARGPELVKKLEELLGKVADKEVADEKAGGTQTAK